MSGAEGPGKGVDVFEDEMFDAVECALVTYGIEKVVWQRKQSCNHGVPGLRAEDVHVVETAGD